VVFHHILCAYDGSPAAEAALDEAIDLASSMRARLAIATVVEKPPAGVAAAGVDPEQLAQTLQHDAHHQLRAAADKVPDDVSLTTLQRTGHAGKQLIKAAEELRADVIVLGTRRRGRTANLFGSVAAELYYHTRLPMLVVSTPE
jgi:nucleotide-binding universal stress UspA family protein